ncbi:MAG: hypothetical protein HY518_02195 [Candidatus Aenigmarchaeota archaeon]|nr:hypothetical protein [Candidatus Aenigmarchaeota archaeon]
MEELKIRIRDYRKVEESLKRMGARFTEELHVVNTYFNQPRGKVLKITEDRKGNYLVGLALKDGKFQVVRNERIADAEREKKRLKKRFGIRCTLKSTRIFSYGKYVISINLIEGVGEFLIVEGENLKPDVITKRLKIREPEFITVSFDRLKQDNKK